MGWFGGKITLKGLLVRGLVPKNLWATFQWHPKVLVPSSGEDLGQQIVQRWCGIYYKDFTYPWDCWGHLLGDHFEMSLWHCCFWEMRVVPPPLVLDAGYPFTCGLPRWFNGGISTSLGCKSATGDEFSSVQLSYETIVIFWPPYAGKPSLLPLQVPRVDGGRAAVPVSPKWGLTARIKLQVLIWEVGMEPQEADQIPK